MWIVHIGTMVYWYTSTYQGVFSNVDNLVHWYKLLIAKTVFGWLTLNLRVLINPMSLGGVVIFKKLRDELM